MTIYSQAREVAIERISQKNIHVCVIGVGTIGLPLATFLAKSGFSVKGLDINEQRVDEINSGNITYEYQNDLKILVNEKKIVATTSVSDALEDVEIIFICVPTPLNENNEIDISNLTEVAERIKDYVKPGMFLIFESSVAIEGWFVPTINRSCDYLTTTLTIIEKECDKWVSDPWGSANSLPPRPNLRDQERA